MGYVFLMILLMSLSLVLVKGLKGWDRGMKFEDVIMKMDEKIKILFKKKKNKK